jgi:hypothetical protein
MDCPCGAGLMQEEQFIDLKKTEGIIWIRGWRCKACDRAFDPVQKLIPGGVHQLSIAC